MAEEPVRLDASFIDFDKGEGLVPVVVQDHATAEVLMLAYMNRDAYAATLESGFMHYWSRSRAALWKKGEMSGHIQKVVSLRLDCDGDTLLATVQQTGVACHEGTRTCFTRVVHGKGAPVLEELDAVFDQRLKEPGESYTGKLLANGNLRMKKLGEEAVEVVMAAKDGDLDGLPGEVADLLYHALVVAKAEGVSYRLVLGELAKRRR